MLKMLLYTISRQTYCALCELRTSPSITAKNSLRSNFRLIILRLLSFYIVGTADGFLYRLQPEIAYNVALSLELEAVYYVAHELAHPYRQLAASAYVLVDMRDVKLDEGEQVFFRDVRRALVVELYQRVLEAREELAERFRAGVYLSPERAVDVILLSLVMRCFCCDRRSTPLYIRKIYSWFPRLMGRRLFLYYLQGV